MIEQLLSGGIFLGVLVGFWDKIKSFLWKLLGIFIFKCNAPVQFFPLETCLFIWDNLKNKKSFSPYYAYKVSGSGKEQKRFVRETGFYNPRFIFINKVPCLVTLNPDSGSIWFYGIKPFINEEKLSLAIIDHFDKNYLIHKDTSNKKTYRSRFYTEYKQGSLLETNNKKYNLNSETAVEAADQESPRAPSFHFDTYEEYDIGRRVNYTAEEYKKLVTFTNERTKLIDNLYLTPNMVELKNKLQKWFDHKKWFMDRSIQWKRGVILHGEPGTGKTSFITALGEYFGVPVFILDISTFTNADLIKTWERLKMNTPCFVVFEDFDSVFNGRTNVYAENSFSGKPVSFDCVLNVLDGAVKFDGIVTFVTTNNIDKIDPALGTPNNPRPGRIDYVYEMNHIGKEGNRFIASTIFKGMENENILIEKSLKDANNKTPAQFKEYCINMAMQIYDSDNSKTDVVDDVQAYIKTETMPKINYEKCQDLKFNY